VVAGHWVVWVSAVHDSPHEKRGDSAMAGIRRLVLAAVAASFSQVAFAQHGDFAPKVQLIVDYLKNSGEACISPAIPGVEAFKACREGGDSIALVVETDVPVRDDDGRAIDRCSASLTATQVPGFPAVKMEVSAPGCPQKTLKAGEFSGIFVGIILELSEWVRKKAKPI
jgi:hypothetical protein